MMKNCHTTLSKTAWILTLIGGLNWGLVGLGSLLVNGDWNVVKALLGGWPAVENIVYLLVGVSAVLMLFGCRCDRCSATGGGAGM